MANSQLATYDNGFGRNNTFSDPFFRAAPDPFDEMALLPSPASSASAPTPFGMMDRMMGQMMQQPFGLMERMLGGNLSGLFDRAMESPGGAVYMQQAVFSSDGRNSVYERKERLCDAAGNDRLALERGANDRAKLRVRHKSAGNNDFRDEVHYRNVPQEEEAVFEDQWAATARSVLQHNRDRMASLASGYDNNNNNTRGAIEGSSRSRGPYASHAPLALEGTRSTATGGRRRSASVKDNVIDVDVQQVRRHDHPDRHDPHDRNYDRYERRDWDYDRNRYASKQRRPGSSSSSASSVSTASPTTTLMPSPSSASASSPWRRRAQSKPERLRYEDTPRGMPRKY